MKKIVCYGDSNTFGYSPKNGIRYDEKIRWTSILQKILGTEYRVINEGMCDRTAFVDNPNGLLFSTQKYFPEFISKSENIDVLILWIGTNDLMFQYNLPLNAAEKGLKNLINLAQTKVKKIIIIPPLILNENIFNGYFKNKFDETSIAKSKEIGIIYKNLAEKHNCGYFDINKFVKPSEIDGLHYEENSHKVIAENLAQLFKSI